MSRLYRVLPLAACVMLSALRGLARDWVKVKLDAPTRQYCHEVRFPLGWQIPDQVGMRPVPRYDFQRGSYEFRVLDLPGSKFLVRGFIPFLNNRDYTTNLYSVDLSDRAGLAQPAAEEEWSSARPVQPESRNGDEIRKYLKSLGFPFTGSGDHEKGGSLSPDRAVFIRFSWKGTLGCCGGSDVPGDLTPHLAIGRNPHGKLFFDAYSTGTGKKLVTVAASFSIILPEDVNAGWVTGRYFFIPLDDRRARCLVCEFGNTR
jgi:hypothetical protein